MNELVPFSPQPLASNLAESARVVAELGQAGALLRGHHFVYTSGRHGPDFVRLDALLTQPDLLSSLCARLIVPFMSERIEMVTACADDRCSQLASFCASSLGVGVGSGEELRGKRTLLAEDALTTGGSVDMLRRNAENHGAHVVGVGVIWNRGSVTAEQLGVPHLEALTNFTLTDFEPEKCKLCEDGVPIVEDEGKGARFKTSHPEYPGGYRRLFAA